MNYLCRGYKAFFIHAETAMKAMAELIRQGRPAEEVMEVLEAERDREKISMKP